MRERTVRLLNRVARPIAQLSAIGLLVYIFLILPWFPERVTDQFEKIIGSLGKEFWISITTIVAGVYALRSITNIFNKGGDDDGEGPLPDGNESDQNASK